VEDINATRGVLEDETNPPLTYSEPEFSALTTKASNIAMTSGGETLYRPKDALPGPTIQAL
ncbi:MAG: hypothetical protein HW403_849, partial [Dehalococcoidia bacterium]|nr:hypothetical protein [Dehalococcoidia bacterium]